MKTAKKRVWQKLANYKVAEVLYKNLHKTLQNKQEGPLHFFFLKHLNQTHSIIVIAKRYFVSFVSFDNCNKKFCDKNFLRFHIK